MTEQEYYQSTTEPKEASECLPLASINIGGIFCSFTKTKTSMHLNGPEGQEFECAPVSWLFSPILDGFCVVGYLSINEEGMPPELEKELLLSGNVAEDKISFTVTDFLLMPLDKDEGTLKERITRFWNLMFELAGAFDQEGKSVPHYEILKQAAVMEWKEGNKELLQDISKKLKADHIILRNNVRYSDRQSTIIKGALLC